VIDMKQLTLALVIMLTATAAQAHKIQTSNTEDQDLMCITAIDMMKWYDRDLLKLQAAYLSKYKDETNPMINDRMVQIYKNVRFNYNLKRAEQYIRDHCFWQKEIDKPSK